MKRLFKLISTSQKHSKRTVILCAIILIVILLSTLSAVFVLKFSYRNTAQSKSDTYYDKYYALITEDRNSGFWKSVYKGAYEEGLGDNIYVEYLGDQLSEDYSKEDMMKIAIAEDVDGIILDADESIQMTSLIDEATEKGIPVITAYNDNTHSKRLSFVGVGSYTMGRVYGKQLMQIAEKVKRQNATKKNGVCDVTILVTAYADQTWQNVLCSGIQATINEDKYEGANINIKLVSVNNSTKFSPNESIRDLFIGEDLPDIIVCLNELNTTCVYTTVVDYNMVGQVRVLGYYHLPSTIKAIERGVVDVSISVDSNQLGRYCVRALQEYYAHGTVSEYFAADVLLINSNNVSEYKDEKDEDKED